MTDFKDLADPELVEKHRDKFAPRPINFDMPHSILSPKPVVEVVKKPKKNVEEKEEEIGESLKAIRAAEAKFREQLDRDTNMNFYFSVVFESPAKLEAFKKKYGLELHYNDFIFEEDLHKALHLE